MKRPFALVLAAWVVSATSLSAYAIERWSPHGGRPTGNVFTPPQDVRMTARQTHHVDSRAPSSHMGPVSDDPRAPENMGNDRFSPDVWAAHQQARYGKTFRPRNARMASRVDRTGHNVEEVLPEPAPEGDVQYQLGDGEEYFDEGHDGCDCGDCGDCDHCGPNIPGYICFPYPSASHILIFGGVHGFKNSRDGGINGNFGFQEGVNISGGLPCLPCLDLAWQIGFQAVQSDLSGTVINTGTRDQKFLTAGLFHRQEVGWQGGVVWDWLRDENQDRIDVGQVRGELSLINFNCREIGAAVAVNTRDSFDEDSGLNWTTKDQYVAYYRWYFENGGNGRLWGGATGDHDGIFGGDAMIPLSDIFSLSVFANYLIPDEPSGVEGATNEAWNIGINLVLHWRCDARTMDCSMSRPMFDVANNGSLVVDQLD